jgi:hypothetical protein
MIRYIRTNLEGLPNNVVEVREKDAIAVGEISSKDILGHFDLASHKLDPTIVASLRLDCRDNDSDDTLRIIGSYRAVYPAPVLQEEPKINGLQERLPLAEENAR